MTPEEIAAAAEAARLAAAAEAEAVAETARLAAEVEAAKTPAQTPAEAAAELVAARADAATARAEAAAAKTEAARFKGIDPAVAAANATKVAEAETARLAAEKAQATAEGNFERLREIQNEEFATRLTAATTATTAADERATAAETRLAAAQLTTAFARSRFFADETILDARKAERLYSDYTEVEDGEVVVYDAPRGSAKRAKVMDGKGNPIAFDVAIKKVVEAEPDKDTFLKSKVIPGAASKTTDGKSVDPGQDRISRLAAAVAKLKA